MPNYVTEEDRDIWNKRYLQGAYAERTSPSEILKDWLSFCPPGRALDVACGAGRNARFLSANGYETVGLDISDVAIRRARELGEAAGQEVEYLVHDLDRGIPLPGKFDLIVIVRFLDWQLISCIDQHLHINGCLLIEQHLRFDCTESLAGPRSNRYRAESGEVQAHISHMQIFKKFEGLITDTDGRRSAVARVLARKIR